MLDWNKVWRYLILPIIIILLDLPCFEAHSPSAASLGRGRSLESHPQPSFKQLRHPRLHPRGLRYGPIWSDNPCFLDRSIIRSFPSVHAESPHDLTEEQSSQTLWSSPVHTVPQRPGFDHGRLPDILAPVLQTYHGRDLQ